MTNGIAYRGQSFAARKNFTYGTHRVCSPEETLHTIQPYFSRVGLTRLADVTHLDRIGIPVVLSVRPNAGYLAVDAGKGFTLAAAKVSAAMETIERFHGETASLPTLRASYADLENPIPLEDFSWARNSIFVPDRPENWVMGWDILNQCEVAVPPSAVLMNRYKWRLSELGSVQSTSNGLASGNHFLEALLSGLLEVVERDATASWQFALERLNDSYIPVVPLDTIEFPLVRTLLEQLHRAQIKPVIFDCTTDSQVPTYMAFVFDLASPHQGGYKGYGAHLDPEIAMIRALTEAIQSRLVFISGARDDCMRSTFSVLKKRNHAQSLNAIDHLANIQVRPHGAEDTDSFEADIGIICDKLQAVGIRQIIVFDLTLPGFDISVVRVVVPKLEGYKMANIYSPGKRAINLLRLLKARSTVQPVIGTA